MYYFEKLVLANTYMYIGSCTVPDIRLSHNSLYGKKLQTTCLNHDDNSQVSTSLVGSTNYNSVQCTLLYTLVGFDGPKDPHVLLICGAYHVAQALMIK